MADFNLDELIKDDDTITFTGRDSNGNKQKFTVKMFLSFESGVIITENLSKLSPIFSGGGITKVNKETLDIVMKIIESVFINQYPFMNKEYLRKNFNLIRLILIGKTLITPIVNYISDMTSLKTETPKP